MRFPSERFWTALLSVVAILVIDRARVATMAQAASIVPDVQSLGPQVGARVPDFTLNDQHGQPRTLTSLLGPRGLMLVFFRSADW